MIKNKVSKNIKYSAINYILVNALKFIVRMVFIHTLPIEYLGINGLFTNVLAMLSLAELGIGPAIVYSLYKPLAINDRETVKSIMSVFRKVYITVGIIILCLGILLIPHLNWFIKSDSNIVDLKWFYFVFLFNTSISYLWSYQRNLLIADQKQYVVNLYQMAVQVIVAVLQIIILYLTSNYWYFIILMLIGTVSENLLINNKAYQEYNYLHEKSKPLNNDIKQQIIKNTKAMIAHKIGGMIVFSSSNIVLSKFVGLAAVGIYSNYYMVIVAVNTFASKFFESITASIGNLLVLESEEKKINAFRLTEFITALQASIIAVGLYILFNPFISLWIGKKYLFDELIVTCIAISFYLMYMRKAVLMFKDASGLFWYDRYKPLAEAIINLVVSIYLAIHYGIIGVIIGSIISTLCTCFWVEPYILFKYGIKYSLKSYFIDYFKFTVLTVVIADLTKYVYDSILVEITLVNFLMGIVGVVSVTITIWLIVFSSRVECKIIIDRLKNNNLVKDVKGR